MDGEPLTPAELEELEFERGRLLARLAELDALLALQRPAAADTRPSADTCWVLLSSAGLLGRLDTPDDLPTAGPRTTHDVIVSAVRTSSDYGVLTSQGRVIRADPAGLPAIPVTGNPPNLQGTRLARDLFDLADGERVIGLTGLSPRLFGWALGTRQGVVKRTNPDIPRRDEWEIIRLEEGDEVVGAVELADDRQQLVFITSDAQLLHYSVGAVRPQGRSGGGMAGIKLSPGQYVVYFGAARMASDFVVTNAGRSRGYQADPGTVKVTPLEQFPEKGRATAGVRCHRFLKGEDVLKLAWAGPPPVIAATVTGSPSNLPSADAKRDASGVQIASSLAAIGTRSLN